MTTEHEDTMRLKFLAKSLNTVAGSVHIAVREEKKTLQMYTWLSKWAETSAPDKIELDDLRFLIDQAMTQIEEQS
jgi:hypothetical protein